MTSSLDGEAKQPLRWIESLRPRVHLDGDIVALAGGEDRPGVELRLGTSATDDDAAGAVTKDGGVGIGDRREQARGHLARGHAQVRVHARHHDVELTEQLALLVEGAV